MWLLIALGPLWMCGAVPVVGAAAWLTSETAEASQGGKSPVDATYGVLWSLEALSDDGLLGTGRYLTGDADGMRARLLAMRDQLASKRVGYYLRIADFVTSMDGDDAAAVTVNVGVAWSAGNGGSYRTPSPPWTFRTGPGGRVRLGVEGRLVRESADVPYLHVLLSGGRGGARAGRLCRLDRCIEHAYPYGGGAGMGGPSDERELRRTRTAYVGAAYRLIKAMERLRVTSPELLPDDSGVRGLPAWSAEQEQAMKVCADTFAEVVRPHDVYRRMERIPSR